MFDFLLTQSNTGNPTEITILITVLSSFFLSSLIVLTYELTTKGIERPVHFLQSMALVSIVSATVMQAIGDSLARGLGMLGALAIIRFRTRLNDPRNIVFMFAAIAAGIACGVLGFTTAFIGTIGFCIAAIILRFSPLSNRAELVGNLRVRLPQNGDTEEALTKVLKEYCQYFELQEVNLETVSVKAPRLEDDLSTEVLTDTTEEEVEAIIENENDTTEIIKRPKRPRIKKQVKELIYLIRMKRKKRITDLSDKIGEITEVKGVRIRFEKHKPEL